jgi:hypothetical protein
MNSVSCLETRSANADSSVVAPHRRRRPSVHSGAYAYGRYADRGKRIGRARKIRSCTARPLRAVLRTALWPVRTGALPPAGLTRSARYETEASQPAYPRPQSPPRHWRARRARRLRDPPMVLAQSWPNFRRRSQAGNRRRELVEWACVPAAERCAAAPVLAARDEPPRPGAACFPPRRTTQARPLRGQAGLGRGAKDSLSAPLTAS